VVRPELKIKSAREFADTSAKEVAVRGFLHQPDNPSAAALVLTHGAGSNCQSPFGRRRRRTFRVLTQGD